MEISKVVDFPMQEEPIRLDPETGDALIQNKLVYQITENQFRIYAKKHNTTKNDYLFIKNKFDINHSSVALILTKDNFVVVGKRSQTFAWTSFVFKITRSYIKYLKSAISYGALQRILKSEIISNYSLFSKNEIDLLREDNKLLEYKEPCLYNCLKLFPNVVQSSIPYDLIDNPKDMILLGGHPNKNETMQNTLLREIYEEGNISSCVKLCPLGTLIIYDHRFKKCFYCNLFLFYTSFTKREVQYKFRPNKEVESISFTLLREQKVHPLEIIQNCLI